MQQQATHRKLPWRWMISIGIIALLGTALVAVLRSTEYMRTQREAERVAAQARWDHANISEYDMVVDKDGCRYNIGFRNNRPRIRSAPMSCSVPPATIVRMFVIASHDGLVEELCEARGCPCESVTSVRSQYDPVLGYPTNVAVNIDLHPAWWSIDLWRYVYENRALPKCQTHTHSVIQVLQFTAY